MPVGLPLPFRATAQSDGGAMDRYTYLEQEMLSGSHMTSAAQCLICHRAAPQPSETAGLPGGLWHCMACIAGEVQHHVDLLTLPFALAAPSLPLLCSWRQHQAICCCGRQPRQPSQPLGSFLPAARSHGWACGSAGCVSSLCCCVQGDPGCADGARQLNLSAAGGI